MRHFFWILAHASLLLIGTSSMWAGPGSPTVTVMTQNMDDGTDLGFALAYLNTSTPTVGIDLTYQEILQSNFAGRAAILAQEIATAKPHMVSLQEATLWTTGPNPSALTPLFDQLQLLLANLAGLGEDYSVVAVNPLTAIALPMSSGVWLGYMDRDVVLARNDPTLSIANIRKGTYAAELIIPSPLGDIPVPKGWIAADATIGGHTFTFVDTHLESTFPGQPLVSLLQAAQAQELATIFGSTQHLVIAGDFNSNATHTPPEQTQSVKVMLAAGLTDTWPAIHHGDPGFTWPLYVSKGEYRENIAKLFQMVVRQCTVSLLDQRGLHHSTTVYASSVLEAAALGLKQLRQIDMIEDNGAVELTVELVTRTVHPSSAEQAAGVA